MEEVDKLWWGGFRRKGPGSVREGWSGEAVSPVPNRKLLVMLIASERPSRSVCSEGRSIHF